jgi:hypothetical protein
MKTLFATFVALAALLVSAVPGHAQFINAQTGTTYTFVPNDCGKVVTFSNGSAIAATLPQASSQGTTPGAGAGTFVPPCRIEVINKGAGTLTITPTVSTIAGGATLALTTGLGGAIISDGTNYQFEP